MFDLFSITPEHIQLGILQVPVSHSDTVVYLGGSAAPEPLRPPKQLAILQVPATYPDTVVYLGASNAPDPPKPQK